MLQPSHPAQRSSLPSAIRSMSYPGLRFTLCCKASAYYAFKFRDEIEHANKTGQQPAVALLGTGTSIEYLVTQIALNSLHIRILLLSNKNSPATRDHLLQACNAVAIVVDKANELSLAEGDGCQLPVVALIELDKLQESCDAVREHHAVFESNDEWNLQSMIIHSSGSTGMPKPIIHTNRKSPLVRMEPLGEGLFECVFDEGFPLAAELWLDESAPKPYRTGDLFIEDPPESGYFVLQGRRDDIPIHNNGEKMHARALAMSLGEDRQCHCGEAVFGTGKPCPSVVIVTRWENVLEDRDVDLEEAVCEVVKECNKITLAHSRIPREMILILGRGETLPVTPKGNVRRNIAWESYGDRVEELYTRLLGDDSTSGNLEDCSPVRTDLSQADVIRHAIADVLGELPEDVTDDQDWYHLGLDSLRAVDLRSKLARVFGSFPMMSTVTGLLSFLESRKKDSSLSQTSINSRHHEWVRSTIQRTNRELDEWVESPHQGPISERNNQQIVTPVGYAGVQEDLNLSDLHFTNNRPFFGDWAHQERSHAG
ncbi:uncharacterized protein MYCGRDRAFT_96439 [Zymoseptoria tritici IPO323]|uniref:Carrier domain-containing protein n=1 Tax=Zymoseptoria tritici (strain CBS 115943 / IPO323) TaxID=336722 RepID=F9XMD8_ZYMTI|nr:uncharacterized protein MYCGRDRAFT_96439 [Zymoseptoria tritici IPO323]EGP83717.1 hypothetical protein MYCGRDRAFT_96439 [Zymoseptoria tritici IPO323]